MSLRVDWLEFGNTRVHDHDDDDDGGKLCWDEAKITNK